MVCWPGFRKSAPTAAATGVTSVLTGVVSSFVAVALIGDRRADLVHVEFLNSANHRREVSCAQCARLREDENAVAKCHERRNGRDAENPGELLLLFGVNLAKSDVWILTGCGLKNGTEPLARNAPVCPEIEQNDLAIRQCLF